MDISNFLKKISNQARQGISSRPYFNHSVEFKKKFTPDERMKMLQKVGLNVFFYPAEMVDGCDLLSDSGTTTMTNEQWAALHLGDEAYGANRGYFLLAKKIREIFGEGFFNELPGEIPNGFIFHQGRSAEDALFTMLGKKGKSQIIPSNGHFDTTRANIEANKISAVDLYSSNLSDNENAGERKNYFKGNINLEEFGKLLKKSSKKIPAVYLTITNNTAAGQPVSLENIRETQKLAHKYGIPLMLDACRFAENAWFIKNYEPGYKNKTIAEIVKEIFKYADGFTISFKKDGLGNMGGGLFLKKDGLFIKKYPDIPEKLRDIQIIKEGNPTYGGMSGRDIMALVFGLETTLRDDYLTYRIKQVRDFGESMRKAGLPIVVPVGGHAVYLNINKFFEDTKLKNDDLAGISFTIMLLAAFGHRACELGHFAFGSKSKVNFVRFAVPRLRYEKQDLGAVAEAVKILYDNRAQIPAVKIVYGKNLALRHFKARFRFIK